MNQATNALQELIPSWNALAEAKVAAKALETVIALKPAESPNGKCFEQCQGKIEFRDLSFRYSTRNKLVLDGVNLVLQSGTTTAVVGPSGSGKSSLVSLIERWYEPESGQILLDDEPLSEMDSVCLHRKIGLVQQVG